MPEIEGTSNKEKEEEEAATGKKNFIKRNMIWNAAPSNAISV